MIITRKKYLGTAFLCAEYKQQKIKYPHEIYQNNNKKYLRTNNIQTDNSILFRMEEVITNRHKRIYVILHVTSITLCLFRMEEVIDATDRHKRIYVILHVTTITLCLVRHYIKKPLVVRLSCPLHHLARVQRFFVAKKKKK